MGLKTPDRIRTFQRKLYLKAKAEPDFRFYLLYDKIYREDILAHAYRLARANRGIAGVDGVTFEQIESEGLDEWLSGIREQLRTKKYNRVRGFLVQRHKMRSRGIRRFPSTKVFGELGVFLPRPMKKTARRVP